MFGFLFGWRRKIRKLRKRWDRLREKALKKKGPLKQAALERLDRIENTLRLLEERKLTRIERTRMSKEVEIGLEEVNAILKASPEELRAVESADKQYRL